MIARHARGFAPKALAFPGESLISRDLANGDRLENIFQFAPMSEERLNGIVIMKLPVKCCQRVHMALNLPKRVSPWGLEPNDGLIHRSTREQEWVMGTPFAGWQRWH